MVASHLVFGTSLPRVGTLDTSTVRINFLVAIGSPGSGFESAAAADRRDRLALKARRLLVRAASSRLGRPRSGCQRHGKPFNHFQDICSRAMTRVLGRVPVMSRLSRRLRGVVCRRGQPEGIPSAHVADARERTMRHALWACPGTSRFFFFFFRPLYRVSAVPLRFHPLHEGGRGGCRLAAAGV